MGILTLKLIDPNHLPAGLVLDASMRGIAIYWQDSPAPAVKRRRRARPEAPPPTWQVQRLGFHAVSPNGEDVPPRDADEQMRFVRAAYVLVACRHPIPSGAEIRYTVRW